MTEPEILKIAKIIEESFPGRIKFSRDTVAVWRRQLEDMPYPLAAQATARACRITRFPPSIAEIRAEAAELVDPVPSVEEAYEEVRDIARKIHPSRPLSPIYSHELVKQAARIVGLEQLAYGDAERAGRRFREAYASLRAGEIRRRQTGEAILPGVERTALPERSEAL